ncbi:biotin-dependent carboxyltransferase family protein [Fodinisporobacter ferrooxydans]|uniref:Biotin-dependent carboxyltransferase family protein n=1 Tax=Fodinisporobacter ferrooxydans TaxID=2901836 RepID=A0ABY4CQR0_9BACL|nr:biotin-dependent carboxyltransferase family protein [Alicyclobacillaceae bacterium MYW30-H2]
MRVLKPGLLSTVQDLGRSGYQKFGVISSGAMDPFALRVSNILIGNDEYEAALELTIVGPVLYFESDMLISICGGDLSASIDGEPVPMWRAVFVRKGSTLTFGAPRQGCRAYLAVAGGFDIPLEMGSRSTYLRAAIGGWKGRALQAGDRIGIRPMSAVANKILQKISGMDDGNAFCAATHFVARDLLPSYAQHPIIRVIRGREFEQFEEAGKEVFFQAGFTLLPQSDRMGYRLKGPLLQLAEPLEMISEAVIFGTVQVPPDGNPIVLMADRQTTGGYPKIAQVISVDLPILGQVNLGATIRFSEVTLEEAQELYLIREMEIDMLKQGIRVYV